MAFLPSWGSSSGGAFAGSRMFPTRTNVPDYPAPTFLNWADQAFGRNELVYACIMEKATSAPEAPLRVFRGPDGRGAPWEDHPLRRMIEEPNPVTSEYELWELTLVHMELSGNAFWEIVRDRAGRPVQLWPIRPDLIRIQPHRNPNIRRTYAVQVGVDQVVDLGSDVVHFKYPNPVDEHLGQPPMRAAIRATALDNEATDFVKLLLQNHAIPPTVIRAQQAVDEATADRLKSRWMERFGGSRRGEPAVLQQGMEIEQLGLNLKDLEFPDLRTISESRICMAFGVPPILVGAKIGLDRSTFANYGEARRSFWEETLMPLQRRLRDTVVRDLLPQMQGPKPRKIQVRFDHSEVLALQESEANRWEQAIQALRAGGITRNQFLQRIGQPPIGAAGDVFLTPAGVVPQPVDSEFPDTVPDDLVEADR